MDAAQQRYALQVSPRCRQHFWAEPWFQARCAELQLSPTLHRKWWELALTAQVYLERLGRGGTACGFGVANEPMPSYLAAHGTDVLVTNIASDTPDARAWAASGQHASDLAALYDPVLVDRLTYDAHTRWRTVDMRAIPADLGTFTFLWSTCALEHLSTRWAGLEFIINACAHLAPGGWAIHTTEYNCTSTTETIDSASTVLFVEPDLVWLREQLRQDGITMLPLDLAPGTQAEDQVVCQPPYTTLPHLNVQYGKFVTTCVALIMHKEA